MENEFNETCRCGRQGAVAVGHELGVAECLCADCYRYSSHGEPELTATVTQALNFAFPRVKPEIRYYVGLGCWGGAIGGMFFGIESDGYVHS